MNNKFFAISIDSLLKTFTAVDAGESVSFQISNGDSPLVEANDCVIGFVGHGIDEFRMIFEVQNVDGESLTMVKKIERVEGVPSSDFAESIPSQLAILSSPGSIVELSDSIGREILDKLYGKLDLAKEIPDVKDLAFQVITYGAPGTGKSHKTKEETDKWKANVFRTTFHPDSDYSTFVGAYKPSMSDDAGRVEVYKGSGGSKVLDATHEIKKGISYEFIPQAFIKAYVLAWKKMNDAPNGEGGKPNPEPVFLVIEEINRGNCAQIFGDIFQLLDRNDAGYSEYPIDADEDLKKFLSKPWDKDKLKGGIGDIDVDQISTRYRIEKEEVKLIRAGKHLMLPPNLLIRATMNTSDQSLFPIDSAFKRRWDWEYVPITEGKDKSGNPLGWKIAFDVPKKVEGGPDATETFEYDWWEFVQRVNEVIGDTTHSEDKKLGYFFVKPEEKDVAGVKKKVISDKRFLEKVIFYLWNDVFKDYGLDKIFTKDGKPVAFHQFFDRKTGAINVVLIKEFIEKLPEVKE